MIAEGEKAGVKLIVLPELFHITNLESAEKESVEMIRTLQSELKDAYVATSIVEDGTHVGVLFNKSGVALKQPQLHKSGRHAWSKLGDEMNVFDAEWGRVALVIGNDAIYPETFQTRGIERCGSGGCADDDSGEVGSGARLQRTRCRKQNECDRGE